MPRATCAQRSAISSFLTDPGDLDELLMRTVRALTQLTGQVAIVQYPSFARANVTHVEFVHLGGARVVVIVVTDTGDHWSGYRMDLIDALKEN